MSRPSTGASAPSPRSITCSRVSRQFAGRRCATVSVVACLAAANSAGAAGYEGFDYPPGSAAEPVLSGGSGFSSRNWTFGQGTPAVRPGSLSHPTGTLLTGGHQIQGVGPFSIARQIAERPGVAGGEFWVSFLMRRGPTPAPFPSPAFGWSGLVMMTDGGAGMFVVAEPGGGPGDGSFKIGTGDDFNAAVSGVPWEPDRDYFLVARFQIGEGNDPATLWVNPPPGTMPPAGGVTFAGADFGRNGPRLEFHAAVPEGVVTSFDEIRFGSSYAEVAPLVPEPATVLPAVGLLAAAAAGRLRRRPA